ncbi:MAG TPA: helix-turn-helix domain-containing protein [Pseudonocardiaceae bacterium]|jgi:hypothetical protein|nr:helix-turn-helix domain-containing protein [Pseudonocardiaceae bacterium]
MTTFVDHESCHMTKVFLLSRAPLWQAGQVEVADSALEMRLDQAIQGLRELLGDGWTVTARPDRESTHTSDTDVILELGSADGSAQFLTDLRSKVSPRSIEDDLLPKLDLLERVESFTHLLVIAPWISAHDQRTLRDHHVSYVDLTGNVFVRSARPAIAIYTQGASREPRGTGPRGERTTLVGAKAGRLVRLLADFAPPYRATSLAEQAGVSLPQVSKLLDTLEDQLLIRRDGRVITEVDWQNLLRARAEQVSLLGTRRNKPYVGMLAPNGVDSALSNLRAARKRNPAEKVALTGSFAARAVAPLATGGQLMLYVVAGPHTPDLLAAEVGLLRVDEGADVLVLRAYDDVVFERSRDVAGLPHVALSQLALDCLSGTGRMPAEGEAVLARMAENESSWRKVALPSG